MRYFLNVLRKFLKMIEETSVLNPPDKVRGMTKWEPKMFEKTVILPHVDIPVQNIGKKMAGKLLANYKLKIPNFPNIQEVDKTTKRVILHPEKAKEMSDKDKKVIQEDFKGSFGQEKHQLTHTNYADALKFVIPEEIGSLSALTIVGHIIYVNLRDELIPYKEVIGQVILGMMLCPPVSMLWF